MSNFQRATAHALMIDGTEYGPATVVHADKVRWESAARANNWTAEANGQTLNAFIAWAALSREKHLEMDFEEFTANLEVAETRNLKKEEEKENPTL